MRMGSVQAATSTDRVRTQPPAISHQPVTVSPSGQCPATSKTHHLPFNTQYSPFTTHHPIPNTQRLAPITHSPPITQYSLAPPNCPRVPADSRSVPVRRRATMQTTVCTQLHDAHVYIPGIGYESLSDFIRLCFLVPGL